MSSPTSIDKRRVWWANEAAKAEYLALPGEVREMADFATTNLQNGREQETTKLKGNLNDIDEVKCDLGGEAYRVFYMRGFPGRVAILGALHKKSPTGKTLTRWWEDRLARRRAGLMQAHLAERKGKI